MRILLAIVHYWNPDGGGFHQSLRSNPQPRVDALQSQLLSLRRLGMKQSLLHMQDRAVYRTNNFFRHDIDIVIITNGQNHVLDLLHDAYKDCYTEIHTSPPDPKFLGFEAQKVLAEHLGSDYDLYGYVEDDLIIHDLSFFHKLTWLTKVMGQDFVLLPHRYELFPIPHSLVDRFYIDGPICDQELRRLIPDESPIRFAQWGGINIPFTSPSNPHSGCFFLNHLQLKTWVDSDVWQDDDVSFISPLESAATLGISKMFHILKPADTHSSWLEIQHFGTSFHSLIGS